MKAGEIKILQASEQVDFTAPAHLLVIGEDKSDCNELSDVLRVSNFAVDVASSFEAGVKKAVVRRPELIVLSVGLMPLKGNVLNVICELSELEVTHKIPVMLISGATKASYCVEALKAGVVDCMLKPLNHDEFRLRIKKQLVAQRQQSELECKLRCYEQRYGPMKSSQKEIEMKDTIRIELEQVYKARRILCADLVDPPSLNNLASMLGTNQPRLSRSFRSVFGVSVFGYLREQRLQRARELLISTSIPIKAIALEIGYRNTSDLTRGIKDRYGMPPSELREQSRVTPAVKKSININQSGMLDSVAI